VLPIIPQVVRTSSLVKAFKHDQPTPWCQLEHLVDIKIGGTVRNLTDAHVPAGHAR
jgi:hypothetical protein